MMVIDIIFGFLTCVSLVLGKTQSADMLSKILQRERSLCPASPGITGKYTSFTGSGSCPVPGHVILTCKLHISGKL